MTENNEKVFTPTPNLSREQLIEKLQRGENLTDEEVNILKYYNDAEERKQLDRIIPVLMMYFLSIIT